MGQVVEAGSREESVGQQGGSQLLNFERAREVMERENLDALVATSPENVTYLSGYDHLAHYVWDELLEVFAVLTLDGKVHLIGSTDVVHYIADRPIEIDAMYHYGAFPVHVKPDVVLEGAEARVVEIERDAITCESSVDGLKRVLESQGIDRSRVAVDESGVGLAVWREIHDDALEGNSAVEAAKLLREIRVIKTEAEISRLKTGVSAVEAGIRAMFDALAPGVSEAELETIFRTEVARLGTDPSFVEAAAGTRSGGMFPTSSYRAASGDILRVDCGGRFGGYWADTGRSAVLGQAEKQKDLVGYHEALRIGMAAMVEEIRPGLPVQNLVKIAVDAVRSNGIPHYVRRHVGHGIGAELYETPILLESQEAAESIHVARSLVQNAPIPVLESGMVINIELPYYEFGLGGLQIEDTVVVRESGSELLTSNGRELRVC